MSYDTQNKAKPITFGLIHGSWHGAWCWDKLIPLLESAGHTAVAMDLAIDRLSSTFETYADTAAEALNDHDNIVLIGHSRAGNVLPRMPSRIQVHGLIYLAAAICQAEDFTADPAETVPKQVDKDYAAGILLRPDGLTEYDSKLAPHFFYNDCTPEDTAWALSKLRPQNRHDDAPPIASHPAVPTASIYCAGDRIRLPEWSRYAARTHLGIEAIEIPGGHSPFLSRPELLAKTLLEIALEQIAASSLPHRKLQEQKA